jgi:hypothetical protein
MFMAFYNVLGQSPPSLFSLAGELPQMKSRFVVKFYSYFLPLHSIKIIMWSEKFLFSIIRRGGSVLAGDPQEPICTHWDAFYKNAIPFRNSALQIY